MANIDLTKYGITGTTEIVYNPSYEMLFNEETKPGLEGYEKGQVSELGAVNVMTGIYTGRSPKDKFIVLTIPPRIPSGGLPMSIRTTTTPPPSRPGTPSRISPGRNSPTSACS